MQKYDLFKKLDGIVAEINRDRSWCEITISFKDGQPELLRVMKTEKLTHTTERTRVETRNNGY
jgi:hypothetical protein